MSEFYGGPTKEMFFFGMIRLSGFSAGNLGDYSIIYGDADTERCHINFMFPHDFHTIVELVLISLPTDTDATTDIDLESDYAANGETYNTHTGTDTASTYALTANKITEIDISGLFASATAGDYAGLRITVKQVFDDFNVIGIRLRYR